MFRFLEAHDSKGSGQTNGLRLLACRVQKLMESDLAEERTAETR